MRDEYVSGKCVPCDLDGIWIGEDDQKCDDCGEKLTLVPMTDPEDVINLADSDLENANMHGIDASKCWDAVKKFIPKKDQLAAAKGLHGFFKTLGE